MGARSTLPEGFSLGLGFFGPSTRRNEFGIEGEETHPVENCFIWYPARVSVIRTLNEMCMK